MLPVEEGYSDWLFGFEDSRLHMPERVIWALLGVAVFSKVNANLSTEGDYFLAWGSEVHGIETKRFDIKEWWGKEIEVRAYLAQHEQIRVKMVF